MLQKFLFDDLIALKIEYLIFKIKYWAADRTIISINARNLSSENDPKDEKIKHQETCNNLKEIIEKLIKEVRFAKPLNKVLSGYFENCLSGYLAHLFHLET